MAISTQTLCSASRAMDSHTDISMSVTGDLCDKLLLPMRTDWVKITDDITAEKYYLT